MSSYSVKKPITVLMGILIIIVLGVFSVSRLPLTLFPDINLPFVVTVTTYEGASPEEVETEIARRIESTVATIGNFEEVQSISNEFFGISIVTFTQSTNMDSVVIEMRELLNNIEFPEGVSNTRILRISPDMLPVMTVSFSREYEEDMTDEEELILNTEWIKQDVLTELQSIPGVADVSVTGDADIVLEINLDSDLLALYNLDTQGVLETIEEQNVGGLVGVALDSGALRMLYLGQMIGSVDEIADLPITVSGGEVIRISDLVIDENNDIRFINANSDSYSKINGKQGIQISFQKQSDIGITDATENIINQLNKIVESDTYNASYTILLDQGEYINLAIGSVLQNIIIGGILAIIILFVFLRDIKPTLIVGLAIPISVISAFMLMYFTGVTLNLISMGGLALGIGMLVDNSIVVIENIYRMINEGKHKKEAAIEGAKQITGAITASTFTTIAVFLPIAFIEGLIAEVFISMALTIAYSLGASLIIALTLVPAMSSRMLSDTKIKPDGKILKKMKNVYKTSVLFTLRHKILTFVTVILLLVGSLLLVVSKGFVLLPESDEGSLSIDIQMTSQTSFALKSLYADEITEMLLSYDDVETVAGSINAQGAFGFMSMMAGGGDGVISFEINLKQNRSHSTSYYESVFREEIQSFNQTLETSIPGLDEDQIVDLSVSAQNSTGALGGASGISIKVSGYDLDKIEIIANEITAIISNVEGVIKPDNGISQGEDNLEVIVNRDQAIVYGLTNQDVLENISLFSSGIQSLVSTQSYDITIEGVEYSIELPASGNIGMGGLSLLGDYEQFLSGIMLFDEDTKLMIDTYTENSGMGIYILNAFLEPFGLYQIGDPVKFIVNPFLKVNAQNEIVMDPMSLDPLLSSFALAPLFDETENSVTTLAYKTGFTSINTDGTNRYVTVTGQIDEGYNITLVGNDVTDQVNAYLNSSAFDPYRDNYNVDFQGENEEIMSAVSDLSIAAIVAILLVYMVMAIQFQSLIYPLIILGTIPLAFTGGMLALLITGSYLSLVSIMGIIILIGVVVNNGIVMIDYINVLRREGRTIKDAIVEAGQTRLRPIFMTALTTILALFTLAIGVGQGAELLQPMAITAIGGLFYATLLTLVFVPTIYAALNRKHMKEEEKAHEQHEG